MEVFLKHQPGPQQGTWSATDYTIHIAKAGRTLCKNGRPDGPADGRLSARGWRCLILPAQAVSCRTCLQRLDRDAVEGTLAQPTTPAHKGTTPLLALHTPEHKTQQR